MNHTKIIQTHLAQCPSTQSLLLSKLDSELDLDLESTTYLVSTDFQSQGKGRKGNEWLHFQQAIAFSFTLDLQGKFGLVMLEVAYLISSFFKDTETWIKWPNDLLNASHQKCGGIIATVRGRHAIVGVGLNLGEKATQKTDFDFGTISVGELNKNYKESIPRNLVSYIESNRLTKKDVPHRWSSRCAHLKREVIIDDFGKVTKGKFLGIDEGGAALIEAHGRQIQVMNGSLRF